MTNTSKLQPGTRIFYTGDMANGSSYGTITKRRSRGKYNPESVDIKFDDPRFDGDDDQETHGLPICCFSPGPGQRFMLAEDYDRQREEKIAAMRADFEARQARTSA